MADPRLTGITIELTDEQKRLLRQISDEDYSELVIVAGTSEQSVPNQYGTSESDQKFISALYETNLDLIERIEANPVVKKDIEDRVEVRGFGPTLTSSLLAQRSDFQSQLRLGGIQQFNPGFTGILAGAAAW